MQAIHTKYISATDNRAAKIKAYTSNKPRGILISIDYELNDVERHFKAARAFIEKEFTYLKESPEFNTMAYGGSADGKGYSFCFLYSKVSVS